MVKTNMKEYFHRYEYVTVFEYLAERVGLLPGRQSNSYFYSNQEKSTFVPEPRHEKP